KYMVLFLMIGLAAEAQPVSGEKIRAHVKFLSSDLVEGRGVSARGGDLATEYIAAQFALAGLKPAGDNGTQFQAVALVGVETEADAKLSASARGQEIEFRWLDDFVGADRRQEPAVNVEAEAIFAGHGIAAPEFHWDDYKGVDVKGKILVLFTN